MTVTNKSYIGYLPETTYSVRNPLTPLNTTQLLKFGEFYEYPANAKAQIDLVTTPATSSFNYNGATYGKINNITIDLKYKLLNGIPIYYALMDQSFAGTTHTLTGAEPGGAKPRSVPRSRTVHMEDTGGTVAKAWDYPGAYTKSLELTHSIGQPLTAHEVLGAQRVVTSSADTKEAVIANADKKPAVDAASGTTPYFWLSSQTSWNDSTGTTRDNASFIKSWSWKVTNNYTINADQSRTTVDEYGKDPCRWIKEPYLSGREHQVSFILPRGDTYSYELEEAVYAQRLDKDIVIKVSRNATTDYILMTFDTSYCPTTDVTAKLTGFGNSDLEYCAYILQPKSVSIDVKDGLSEAEFV